MRLSFGDTHSFWTVTRRCLGPFLWPRQASWAAQLTLAKSVPLPGPHLFLRLLRVLLLGDWAPQVSPAALVHPFADSLITFCLAELGPHKHPQISVQQECPVWGQVGTVL